MKNWKKMIAAAAALGSLVLFAGCTTASAVSLEEAKDLVQQTVGAENAVVIEQETDREDGVYELEIIVDGVSYEFEVDRVTGEVREVEREDDRPAPVQTTPVETAPVETAPAEPAPAETQPQRISLEEAKSIAYTHAGVSEADAYDKSYENDDGRYEIDFEYDGWDYEYDIGYDGTTLSSRKDRDDDHHTQTHHEDSHHTAATEAARITADEAWSIALAHAGVSDIRDRDCEWDDGCWELSFDSGRTEYEYKISADGTILKAEKDTDD